MSGQLRVNSVPKVFDTSKLYRIKTQHKVKYELSYHNHNEYIQNIFLYGNYIHQKNDRWIDIENILFHKIFQ